MAIERSPDGLALWLVVASRSPERGERRARVVFSSGELTVGPFLPAEPSEERTELSSDGDDGAFASSFSAHVEADAVGFVEGHASAVAQGRLQEAQRTLARTRAKLARRLDALTRDTDGMARADEAAAFARLFVAEAHRHPKAGPRQLEATDWSTGEPRTVVFPLRGDRPPATEVEAVFARAKRLRGGLAIIDKRRADTEWAMLLLDETSDELASWEPVPSTALADAAARTTKPAEALAVFEAKLAARLRRLTEALPGDIRLERVKRGGPAHGRSGVPTRVSFRTFRSCAGTPLLVGKGGADNDALTLHTARPHDWFFHVKDSVGAHVIAVRPTRTTLLDARVAIEAALLAAHFSSQRGEAVVDVQSCERRHLRKRKGAPPGLVELTQEKIVSVRVDEAHLTELLATEDRDG